MGSHPTGGCVEVCPWEIFSRFPTACGRFFMSEMVLTGPCGPHRQNRLGSVGLTVSANGSQSYPIALYSYSGQVEVRFQYMRKPFGDPAKREELRQKLNAIAGVNLPSGKQRPSI